jgi:hypothetical protein
VEASVDGAVVGRDAEEDPSVLVRQLATSTGGPFLNALRNADRATVERFRAAVRARARTASGEAESYEVAHDYGVAAATSPVRAEQSSALEALAGEAAGSLRVRWDDLRGGPASLDNLFFVRRGVNARTVVEQFFDAHFANIASLWALGGRDELAVVGETPTGHGVTTVHVERRVGGLPVQGQWVEVQVTTDESRFGAGIVQRLNAAIEAEHASLPPVPRNDWIDATRASRAAREGVEPVHRRLELACHRGCVPLWVLGYRDGRVVSVHAISGEVLTATETTGHLGPVQILGWPVGSTAAQPIRFRAANVTSTSTGASVGQTSWADGTHSFTASDLAVSLQGPVGSSNPAARGRVYRDQLVGGVWTSLPLTRAWNAGLNPAQNFGNPDLWAPNSDPNVAFPHVSEILYGWLSYWQYLVGTQVGLEIPDRVAFSLGAATLTGFLATQGPSGNYSPAGSGPNGESTWGTVFVAVGAGDDINAAAMTTNGDDIWSTAHEYGHLINACAASPGTGCLDLGASAIPLTSRPGWSDWRAAIHQSHVEPGATALANIVTQFRYDNRRTGVPFDPAWNYASYDSTADSFGTPTQQAPTPFVDCFVSGCPSGFQCVPSGGLHRVSTGTYDGGFCAPLCATWTDPNNTPSNFSDDVQTFTAACQTGLVCAPRGYAGTPTNLQFCWHNSYLNKFFDTVGDRLTYMTSWLDAMRLTYNAISGQSQNASRDFVLGSDSYYERYTASQTTRYEAMRAVRSVYSGTGFVPNDDFPDIVANATPIPVRSTDGVWVAWGNGSGEWPNFDNFQDVDSVMFRGIAGSQYVITASLLDFPGFYPYIDLWRLNGTSLTYVGGSWTGLYTTPALPQDGWYFVSLWGGPGRWDATVSVLTGADDFHWSPDESWPLAHNDTLSGVASAWDMDTFHIDVPVSGTSLQFTVGGTLTTYVDVWYRNGTSWQYHSTYFLDSSVRTFTIPSVSAAGRWAFILVPTGTGAYTVNAQIGCATTSACDHSPGVRTVVPSWGDRFAGRLAASEVNTFQVTLSERDNVSVAVTDNGDNCRAILDVVPPPEQRHFRDGAGAIQPVLSWRDGAASNTLHGDTVAPGAHFEAITSGTYELRVRPKPGFTCPVYRLHVARTTQGVNLMPAW